MKNQLIFKELALQYAQASNNAERDKINLQAKKMMEDYINQGTIEEQATRINEIYELMKQDLNWIKDLVSQDDKLSV